MILLQSKDRFDDILIFDPPTGEGRPEKRSNSPALAEMPISGTFASVSDHRLMFYRVGSELRFSIDNETVVIDETTKSSLIKTGDSFVFLLEKEGEKVIQFIYSQEDLEQPIPGDTTAHVEDEDFDFCLFVHNILSNPERRRFIYIKVS